VIPSGCSVECDEWRAEHRRIGVYINYTLHCGEYGRRCGGGCRGRTACPLRFAQGDTDGLWLDKHAPHKFYIDRAEYGKSADFDEDVLNEANTSLAEVLRSRVNGFTHVYDFGGQLGA
jgi:hypothetical protein